MVVVKVSSPNWVYVKNNTLYSAMYYNYGMRSKCECMQIWFWMIITITLQKLRDFPVQIRCIFSSVPIDVNICFL